MAEKLDELGITDNMYVGGTSGNGYHLLLRIDLPNNDESKKLVVDCLKGLQALVGTGKVDIDQCVHNAARVMKSYGTMARKGMNDPKRPWRMAKLSHIPECVEIVSTELLERIAAFVPQMQNKRAVNALGGIHI